MEKVCIVGIGNPDSKYLNTRHNIGRHWVEEIASFNNLKFSYKKNLKSFIATKENMTLLIPDVYVNNSGTCVKKFMQSTNITSEKLLVFHDDIDLELGVLKLKKTGGHAGHNGIRDIMEKIGEKNFYRLRIGVGHPGHKDGVTNWVLGKFTNDEQKVLGESFNAYHFEFDDLNLSLRN